MILDRGHMIFGAACLIAGIVLGAGFRSCSSKPAEPALRPEVIHDTVTIHDTLRIKEHTKPKEVVRVDTCWLLAVTEDSLVTDSVVPVEVPIMQYAYRDTFETDSSRIELGITYEGYKAKIDNIDLNYTFDVKPRTIGKKKGWGQFLGLGIGLGYGAAVVNGSVYAGPEVGVHVTYGWGYHW